MLFVRNDVHQVQLSSVTWRLEGAKKKPLLIIFISLECPMGASSGIHDKIAVRGSEFVLLDG